MRFLTADEMAEALGVHASTVRELAAAGRVPGAFRVGRLWRFDLDAFRAAGGVRAPMTGPTAPPGRPAGYYRNLVDTVIAGG